MHKYTHIHAITTWSITYMNQLTTQKRGNKSKTERGWEEREGEKTWATEYLLLLVR